MNKPHIARPAYAGATHVVENQAPPLQDYNAYLGDTGLKEAVHREGGGWGEDRLTEFGAHAGSAEVAELARLANTELPVLRTHDRHGNRIDEVEFHPAYHELMAAALAAELPSLPWREPRAGAHVVRAALHILQNEVENGVACPIAMTFAGIPALRAQPEIAKEWEPLLTGTEYDKSWRPAQEKKSAQLGMAMTEKQGGSDVRANTTRAVPLGKGGPGGEYELTGHKWFCSAPMCDAFLTLAYTDKGLSCFIVPRWLPDGTRNRFFIQRLKDKMGNKSNASSEIEYDRTWARMVGEDGRGVPTIIEMVRHTRLETCIGTTGIMRGSVAHALNHASHRRAFQKKLIDQPLMKNVLADLALESEAATALTLRVARAFDEGKDDGPAGAFCRIATPVAKYWTCKRTPGVAYEAMECHGGNGYVEDYPLARLYREAPLNGIWEGSGNVICLDVLRALHREPDSADALVGELESARGGDARFDTALDGLKADLAKPSNLEPAARRFVERLALALQASILVRHAPPAVAGAFCASRLAGDHGGAYGTLPPDTDFDAIIERALPAS